MDQVKIGEFLKELRKSKNLTQQEAADSLYVSQKTISRWETGEGIPDISIILEVARFYNVTVDEILEGKRKEEKIEEKKQYKKIVIGKKKENIVTKLNTYLFIAVGIVLFCLILGVIFYFVLTEDILKYVLPISWVIGISLYLFGYNEIKENVEEKDKKKLRKKSIILSDVIFITLLIYLIMLGGEVIW